MNIKQLSISFFVCSVFLVNSVNAFAHRIQMAEDSTGHAIAAWHAFDTINSTIKASYYDGTSWAPSPPQIVSDVEITPHHPFVDINNNQKAVIVWRAKDPTTLFEALYGATLNGNTMTWSALPTRISQPLESVYEDYMVSISDNDVVVVTWSSIIIETGETEVRAMVTPFGVWTGPVTTISN